MISLINASAFRSDDGYSTPLTPDGWTEYLAKYASSKVRLWAYHCSLSRLVFRIERPAQEVLRPIDLIFVSVSDVRCPVHWNLSAIEVFDHGPESTGPLLRVPSANVSISASTL